MINDDAKKKKLLRDVLEREGYRDMDEIARLHGVSVKTAYGWLAEVREKVVHGLENGSLGMAEVRNAIPKKLLDRWMEATAIRASAPPLVPSEPSSEGKASDVKVTLDGDYVNIRIPAQMFLRLFSGRSGSKNR